MIEKEKATEEETVCQCRVIPTGAIGQIVREDYHIHKGKVSCQKHNQWTWTQPTYNKALGTIITKLREGNL